MAAIWPFRVNWREPYRVTYSFKTDVITSRSGLEQRRSLRIQPRKRVEFLTMARGEQLDALRRVLLAQQSRVIDMPEVTRRLTLGGAATVGSTTLQLNVAAPAWCVAGARLFLAPRGASGGEVATLLGVSGGGTTLNLTAPISTARAVGDRVYPALRGRLADQLRLGRETNRVAELDVRFDVDPGSEPALSPPAAPVTFNGREVFGFDVNWRDRPEEIFLRPVDIVDFDRGRVDSLLAVRTPGRRRQAQHQATSVQAADALRDAFLRARGQRGEFHITTGEPDITLALAFDAGATEVRVSGTETAAAYAEDRAHRTVQILLSDGRSVLRSVTGLAAQANASVLTLSAGMPWGGSPSTVARIAWAPVCRFAGDDLTIEWLTDSVARSTLNFQQLEAL